MSVGTRQMTVYTLMLYQFVLHSFLRIVNKSCIVNSLHRLHAKLNMYLIKATFYRQ